MSAVRNVSLVRESSSPAVYLVVGDKKFWVESPAEMSVLGFEWGKVRVVSDHSLDHLTERRLNAPPRVRPSEVFFDCGNDYDSIDGKHYFNCKESACIVHREVLVAGWLVNAAETGPAAAAWVNVQPQGVEDVHYHLKLDPVFLDRVYGPGGLSRSLETAMCPANPPTVPIAFADTAPASPGGPRRVRFNSWSMFGFGDGTVLKVELNAWHVQFTGGLFARHFEGRGPQPAFWVNPLSEERNAFFPFDPRDPEGSGRPLAIGDYVLMRGCLWQDGPHGPTDPDGICWNLGGTANHGWLELHPPDWIVRVAGPAPNARVTTAGIRGCLRLGDAQVTDSLTITPDFPPSSAAGRLRLRRWEGLVDGRFTQSAPLVSVNPQPDRVDISVPITGSPARFKATWLATWSETDSRDRSWVDDSVPAGAQLFVDGEGWNWVSADPEPFTGTAAHRSGLLDGMHQHYFIDPATPLTVSGASVLFAMVYLDPDNPPDEVMLQWRSTDWLHRAYWGDDLIGWGTPSSSERRPMGRLPFSGEWVRLEVTAKSVGLGSTITKITGMAFTLYNGRATWDYAGVRPS